MTSKPMLLAALSMSSLALAAPAGAPSAQAKRGEYLVNFGGCPRLPHPEEDGTEGP